MVSFISFTSSLPLLLLAAQGQGQGQGQAQSSIASPQTQQQLQESAYECGGEYNPTLVGIICGHKFDFVYRTLCEALQVPANQELFETLDNPEATSTVWAPDNLAFENLNALENVQEILFNTREGQPMFTNVLLSHVAEGYIPSDELSCNGEIKTLFGTSTTICDSVTGPIFQVGPGNTEKEFRPKYDSKYGIEACNGMIYAIDNVILPLQSLQSSPIVEEAVEVDDEHDIEHEHKEGEEHEHEEEEESSTSTSTKATVEPPVTSASLLSNTDTNTDHDHDIDTDTNHDYDDHEHDTGTDATSTSTSTIATTSVRGECENKEDYLFKGLTCEEAADPKNNKCKRFDTSTPPGSKKVQFYCPEHCQSSCHVTTAPISIASVLFPEGYPISRSDLPPKVECGLAGALPTLNDRICNNGTNNFTNFCDALNYTGLNTLLANAGNYTVWGSTNAGFDNLPAATQRPNFNNYIKSARGFSLLKNILKYNIANGEYRTDALFCNARINTTLYMGYTHITTCVEPVPNLADYWQKGTDNVIPKYDPKYLNEQLLTPIEACNGMLYKMTNVILPAEDPDDPASCAPSATPPRTMEPTTKPTEEILSKTPSDTPSDTPTDTPTNAPSDTPTNAPTPAPTNTPSDTPTNAPSDTPTNTPSDTPTNVPSDTPTNAPSDTPTNAPSDTPTYAPVVPTAPPTTGTPTCTVLSPCNCVSGCVEQLTFKYTGKDCPKDQMESGWCTNVGFNPFLAVYQITNAADPTQVVSTGEVQQGELVTITALTCVPDQLVVTISVPTGAVTQTIIIDATCKGGQGLLIAENYGSFEFTDYTCPQTEPPTVTPEPTPIGSTFQPSTVEPTVT